MGDRPLGQRICWPIYHAAEKNKLTVCIHAGSTYRHAPDRRSATRPIFVEDYVAQSAAFETVLLSLLAEGVFQKFPELKVVLAESGVTWLPQFLWRNDKIWRGVRPEVPWIDRVPREIVHDHVRSDACSRSMPRPTPKSCRGSSNISAPTTFCSFQPTTRTGILKDMTSCRRDCLRTPFASS